MKLLQYSVKITNNTASVINLSSKTRLRIWNQKIAISAEPIPLFETNTGEYRKSVMESNSCRISYFESQASDNWYLFANYGNTVHLYLLVLVLVRWWTAAVSSGVHFSSNVFVISVFEHIHWRCLHNVCRQAIPAVNHSLTEKVLPDISGSLLLICPRTTNLHILDTYTGFV